MRQLHAQATTDTDKCALFKELLVAARVKREQECRAANVGRGLAAASSQMSGHKEEIKRLQRQLAEKVRMDAEDRRFLAQISSVGESITSVPTWVRPSSSILPAGAFLAGHDGRFGVYVVRGPVCIGTIPGKYPAGHPHAHIPWGGEEHLVGAYQLLVVANPNRVRWIACSDGSIPSGTDMVPIVGGVSESGEIQIGRAHV